MSFDPWSAAILGGFNLLGSMSESNAMQSASQPLPTYYQYTQSPEQQQMWQQMWPMFQNMMSGDWWGNMDSTIKESITAPHQESMNMAADAMGAWGGNPSAGYSGAAGKVLGEMAQEAAPTMYQTAWQNYMTPMMSMMPQMMSDMLAGNTSTIQQIQQGAAMPPDYAEQLRKLMSGYIAPQKYPYTDWGLGIGQGAGGFGIGGSASGSVH